ncbi:ABC transporter G family member 8 [Apostasia shenzhenica]|uniref:ABC transporter G family member 8 n=1 Tax=Apostasia shenzhenica TaxID=1088818 RepID=A0A2I0AFY5_9ASPA|nr:ABC transporter G family member 8 [Apostasia shenzhenica]
MKQPPPYRPPSPASTGDISPPSLPSPPDAGYVLSARSIYYAKPPSPFSSLSLLLTHPAAAPTSFILRDVSLSAHPGEILAIAGPSGAGKSTLLDILASRLLPTSGSLLLNSSPLHRPSFRRLSAYLPQQDSFLPLLTVFESFIFTARLLLPPSAAAATATALLADLRLSHLADTPLPGPLSGGERRRVSVGLSLLRDPAILLLDEPTSGLDSSSALLLVRSLRRAAASPRRTAVVLSIHQPSSQLLSAFDSVLLLCRGSVLHHGDLCSLSSFLSSSGFPLPSNLNPLEFALEILPLLRCPSPPLPAPPKPHNHHLHFRHCPIEPELHYPSNRLREIALLHGRFWKIIYRSRQLLLTNTLEALIVGILLGTIYINAGDGEQGKVKRLGFFAFSLTFLLSSTTETLPIFVTERPILLREVSSGIYRLSSHLIATTLVFLPYLLAISVLYSSSVYFLVGLCSSWQAFASFVLTVWAVVLAANSFVLFVSSVAPDYIAGTSLVTLALAGFFLFSGYFLRRERMPSYWIFMHYLSPYRYALDAMVENEYGCEKGRCFGWEEEEEGGGGGRRCRLKGSDVLRERGLTEGGKWVGLQVLIGYFVLYRVLYLLVLLRRAGRCKR